MVLISPLVGNACAEACDATRVAGIRITVVDGATGSPFAGAVTIIATEGSYTETINPPAGAGFAGLAHERPGIYRVEVQAPGYVTWVATNVRVNRNDCHVETVLLTAELEPSGAT
jgi:hypothetical protein